MRLVLSTRPTKSMIKSFTEIGNWASVGLGGKVVFQLAKKICEVYNDTFGRESKQEFTEAHLELRRKIGSLGLETLSNK